ncbi:hypothetical protein C1M51_11070 [Methylibium sp. Pch-M]|uniref:PH domain-containing protein n=1 Tax=Methylibium sp. Pch-M TaxID=2082386 RepID=UPI0010130810|nr:PH domain-containing protein [Methylibium sp. Pch-M]QAZ39911.1 hypothetical protein C1M51_11070 [Methylibium sp. Pch-M]
MVFRSKVDAWLLVVLLAGAAAVVVAALHTLRMGAGWFIPLVLVLMGAGLPVWLLVSTRYTVASGNLAIRSGPFVWRIVARDIIDITSTRSALSSPALSLDRIRIDYRSGQLPRSVLVSPKDKAGFVSALRAAQAEA